MSEASSKTSVLKKIKEYDSVIVLEGSDLRLDHSHSKACRVDSLANEPTTIEPEDLKGDNHSIQQLDTWFSILKPAVIDAVIPRLSSEDHQQVEDLIGCRTVHVVLSDAAAGDAVRQLLEESFISGVLAWDTETATKFEFMGPIPIQQNKDGKISVKQPTDGPNGYPLNSRKAEIRLLQCYAGGTDIYVFDMRFVSWKYVEILFQKAPVLAGFNLVFDVKFLLSAGIEPISQLFDTQLAMRLVAPCEVWPISMEDAADLALDIRVPKILGKSDWSKEHLSPDQIKYAALDALVTYNLYRRLMDDLLDDQDKGALEPVNGSILATARMENNGMSVDVSVHKEFIETWQKELVAAQDDLAKATQGKLIGLPTDNEVRAYIAGLLSPSELENWPRTKTGAIAANIKCFANFGAGIPGLTELAALKTWVKGLQVYGQSLLNKVEDDGRIHAQFLLSGARTGRSSSRNPNLQNIPARSRSFSLFRQIFAAQSGRKIMAADYSQIELRVMAEESREVAMLDAYKRYGDAYPDKFLMKVNDLHTLTARSMTPCYEDMSEEDKDRARSLAKAMNFGLIYGSGPKAFREYCKVTGISLTLAEAEDAVRSFRATYPFVYQWQCNQTKTAKALGYVETRCGRRWYWNWRARSYEALPDDISDYLVDDFLMGFERNFSLNMPIQGTAAEVMLHALSMLDREIRHLDAKIVAVVHDEVVLDVSEIDLEPTRKIIDKVMTSAWRDIYPEAECRGIVEIKSGCNWREAH